LTISGVMRAWLFSAQVLGREVDKSKIQLESRCPQAGGAVPVRLPVMCTGLWPAR